MKHLPFDYCDDCGRKFPIGKLKEWLCEECRPTKWKPAELPVDEYDRTTKSEDDQS